jgi:hypothetical protein
LAERPVHLPPPAQHQKRSLESVLGILFLSQHPPTHPEHKPPMAAHQGCESRFVALEGECM